MGMSADYDVAIKNGATFVKLGVLFWLTILTGIFFYIFDNFMIDFLYPIQPSVFSKFLST